MVIHQCTHCAREFNRYEHLVRHERTHTKEKPYRCNMCAQKFARRDLLRRHEIKAHNINQHRSPNNANSPKTQPPKECNNYQQLPAPALGPGAAIVHQPPSRQQPILNPLPLDLGPSSSIPNQDYLLPDAIHWLEAFNAENGTMEGIDLFNTGALESPDSIESHLPSIPVNSSDSQTRSILSHPGSPLLQSAPSAIPTSSYSMPRQSPKDMTAEYWEGIRAQVSSLNPLFQLPKQRTLGLFIRRYFRSFQRHQPLIHEPTFSPDESPYFLVLALCANGALYSLERDAAVEMHRIAVQMTEKGDDNLQTLQALMLLGAFSAWDGSSAQLDNAVRLHGRMAILLRKLWASINLDFNPEDDLRWESWKAKESLKRATYCVFTLMNLMTIAFNIPSPVILSDVHGLPAQEDQWNSCTEVGWSHARLQVHEEAWCSASAVIRRLADESLPVPSNIGMFGCHLLISCLVQKIILFRRICPAESPAFLEMRSYFLRLLKRWQQMWENEPESTLSPDNPHGPILFNCTAILRVAYIRLVLDYSPVRESFSVCPLELTVTSLENLDLPERSHETTRAVLQACLALRVPAQLGFRVVARTNFWGWSVQHGLTYFECAILLSQWCQAVAGTQDLTGEEQEVLSLVEQLIGATGGDLGPHDSHMPLHVVVLYRWAELLDTGETTVWRIMPQMASVLRIYASRLLGQV